MKDLYTVIESILDDDFAEKTGDEVRFKLIAKESLAYLNNILPRSQQSTDNSIRIANLESWVNNMHIFDSKIVFKTQRDSPLYYAYMGRDLLFAVEFHRSYYQATFYIYMTKEFSGTPAGRDFEKMLSFASFKEMSVHRDQFKICRWKNM